MSAGVLATAWQTYAAKLLPADITPTQLRDARRAFYAGAYSMLTLLKAGAELPEDDREHFKATLRGEVAMHMATVGSTLEGRV